MTASADIAAAPAPLRPRLLQMAQRGEGHGKILAEIRAARWAARPTRQAAQAVPAPLLADEAARAERERNAQEREARVEERERTVAAREGRVEQRERVLSAREGHAEERDEALDRREAELWDRQTALDIREAECETAHATLKQGKEELDRRDAAFRIPEETEDLEDTLGTVDRTARRLGHLSRVLRRNRREEGSFQQPPIGKVLYAARRQLAQAAALCDLVLGRLGRDFRRHHPEQAAREEQAYQAWLAELWARVERRCETRNPREGQEARPTAKQERSKVGQGSPPVQPARKVRKPAPTDWRPVIAPRPPGAKDEGPRDPWDPPLRAGVPDPARE